MLTTLKRYRKPGGHWAEPDFLPGFGVENIALISCYRLLEDELGDVLHMLGVGEHIDGLDASHTVFGREHIEVARLSGGVAADIYYFAGLHGQELLDHFLVHAGTRRIGDDNIGLTMGCNKFGGEHFGHIASMELGVGDMVALSVFACCDDGVFNIFDTHHMLAHTRKEERNGASAGVEVVNDVGGLDVGKLGSEGIKTLSLG